MAQGRGRWRKWRGAVVGDAFQLLAPTHMGCFLLHHLYPFFDFFLSKLIDSILVGSDLFNTRAEVLERLPREGAPSRGFHPREATYPRQATHPQEAFILAKRHILARHFSSSQSREVSAPLK